PGTTPRGLLAPLAARVYGHPDRELVLAGVTGTNGKSTVATLLAAVLEAAGRRAGFIGTLGYRLGSRAFPGERTTPEVSDLFRTLRRMRQARAAAGGLEASAPARPRPRRGGRVRRRRLHQSHPRPPRPPSRHGGVLRRQAQAVRPSEAG